MQSSYKVIKSTEIKGSELITPPIIERISSSINSMINDDENIKDIYTSYLDDAKEKAKQILNIAEQKAKEIADISNRNASKVLEKAREDGYQDGYRKGYQEGYEFGVNEAHDEANSIRANADEYIKGCYREAEKFVANKEKEILNLAVTIAQQVIRAELTTNVEIVHNIAQGVLARAMDKKQIILKVNPMDFNMVVNRKADLSIYVENSNNLFIIADANIPAGSVKAETPSGFIDGSIDTQLNVILKSILEG